MLKKNTLLITLFCLAVVQTSFARPSAVEFWLTNSEQSALLQKQPEKLSFAVKNNEFSIIQVDENQKFQAIDGFGFTLTGGSAFVINQLDKTKKQKLLQEFVPSPPKKNVIFSKIISDRL